MSALLVALPLVAPALPATVLQPVTKESQSLPSLAPMVESVKGAVVNVDVQSKVPLQGMQQNPFFHEFGGPQGHEPIRQGAGSGFIIDPKGLVLTNNHVVEGAVAIQVRLDDGRSFAAEVVGRDPLTDVAVIRLKGKVEKLPTVQLGDSEGLRVGDWVLAIGNPYGLASSVSLGIISARTRDIGASRGFDEFLQTDAAINPGNSGGPLFNMRGEVVGINTAIVGGSSGIGFAVPSNLVKALLPQLEKEGTVTRAWLGIGIQDLTRDLSQALSLPVSEGVIVTNVNEGSPAAKGGLKGDDVIIAVDGHKVGSSGELVRTVALKKPGGTATLELYRGGKKMQLKLTLGTRPDIEGVGERVHKEGGEDSSKARVGLSLSNVDPRTAERAGLSSSQGALITDVVPGSPAERGELRPGMVVVEVDRKPVRTADELARIIRKAPAGSLLLLRVEVPGSGRFLRALRMP